MTAPIYTADMVESQIKKLAGAEVSDSYLAGFLSQRLSRIINIVTDDAMTDAEKVALLKIIVIP